MTEDLLEPITQLLVDYLTEHDLPDVRTQRVCRQLAGHVLDALPKSSLRRVQREPARNLRLLHATLTKLLQDGNPGVRVLVDELLDRGRAGSSQSGAMPFGIQASHAQVTVRYGSGNVTNIMNTPGPQSQGEAATTSTAPGSSPELKIHLRSLSDSSFEIWVQDSPTGRQGKAVAPLPTLIVAENTLRCSSSSQQEVGQQLYQALSTDGVREAIVGALDLARMNRVALELSLYFDEKDAVLVRYPWELLHDGRRHLVASGAVRMYRSIAYAEATPQFSLHSTIPARVLVLFPSPTGTPPLNRAHLLNSIREFLDDDALSVHINMKEIANPTLETLRNTLEFKSVDILHFVGHGSASIQGTRIIGELAFEDSSGDLDLVNTTIIEHVLSGHGLQAAVVLACSSGEVQGVSVFGGVGLSLIQAGIPAVVAAQTLLSEEAAAAFTSGFYRSLAQGDSIVAAVTAGQRRIYPQLDWFVPALYFRGLKQSS